MRSCLMPHAFLLHSHAIVVSANPNVLLLVESEPLLPAVLAVVVNKLIKNRYATKHC